MFVLIRTCPHKGYGNYVCAPYAADMKQAIIITIIIIKISLNVMLHVVNRVSKFPV